jgi:hypothetical protein
MKFKDIQSVSDAKYWFDNSGFVSAFGADEHDEIIRYAYENNDEHPDAEDCMVAYLQSTGRDSDDWGYEPATVPTRQSLADTVGGLSAVLIDAEPSHSLDDLRDDAKRREYTDLFVEVMADEHRIYIDADMMYEWLTEQLAYRSED